MNPRNEPHPFSNERTKAVQDVIADLCVMNKEVVAVDLRLWTSNENLHPETLIATNDKNPDAVIYRIPYYLANKALLFPKEPFLLQNLVFSRR
jgi:hypothetical protein